MGWGYVGGAGSTGSGGGIANDGTLVVVRSLLTGNRANGGDGGTRQPPPAEPPAPDWAARSTSAAARRRSSTARSRPTAPSGHAGFALRRGGNRQRRRRGSREHRHHADARQRHHHRQRRQRHVGRSHRGRQPVQRQRCDDVDREHDRCGGTSSGQFPNCLLSDPVADGGFNLQSDIDSGTEACKLTATSSRHGVIPVSRRSTTTAGRRRRGAQGRQPGARRRRAVHGPNDAWRRAASDRPARQRAAGCVRRRRLPGAAPDQRGEASDHGHGRGRADADLRRRHVDGRLVLVFSYQWLRDGQPIDGATSEFSSGGGGRRSQGRLPCRRQRSLRERRRRAIP